MHVCYFDFFLNKCVSSLFFILLFHIFFHISCQYSTLSHVEALWWWCWHFSQIGDRGGKISHFGSVLIAPSPRPHPPGVVLFLLCWLCLDTMLAAEPFCVCDLQHPKCLSPINAFDRVLFEYLIKLQESFCTGDHVLQVTQHCNRSSSLLTLKQSLYFLPDFFFFFVPPLRRFIRPCFAMAAMAAVLCSGSSFCWKEPGEQVLMYVPVFDKRPSPPAPTTASPVFEQINVWRPSPLCPPPQKIKWTEGGAASFSLSLLHRHSWPPAHVDLWSPQAIRLPTPWCYSVKIASYDTEDVNLLVPCDLIPLLTIICKQFLSGIFFFFQND